MVDDYKKATIKIFIVAFSISNDKKEKNEKSSA